MENNLPTNCDNCLNRTICITYMCVITENVENFKHTTSSCDDYANMVHEIRIALATHCRFFKPDPKLTGENKL
jgi:hypothetical protein